MTKIRQFIFITLILCLAMLLQSCGQMTAEDEGLDSKSIEEASGSTGITTDDTNTDNTTTDNSTTTATSGPDLTEVTAVTTPTNDSTPNYTFSSSEAGTFTY